jgi:hypothetical protein
VRALPVQREGAIIVVDDVELACLIPVWHLPNRRNCRCRDNNLCAKRARLERPEKVEETGSRLEERNPNATENGIANEGAAGEGS